VIEARPKECLGVFWRAVAASREEPADGLWEAQLVSQRRDHGGIGLRREQPARFRSEVDRGDGHRRKLWFATPANNHQSVAYSITPQPSQTSVAPVPAMTLRRCSGIIVSQLPHECPRSGNTAWTRFRDRIRS